MSHRTHGLTSRASHEEVWLLLPWLANGSLPDALRRPAAEHLAACAACRAELTLQRRLREALAAPERISYAPTPSLAKLLQRINAAPPELEAPAPAPAQWRWRAPGIAWAATVLLACALAASLAYRPPAPVYQVRSDAAAPRGAVLHVIFARDLTIAGVEQLLGSAGAQVAEGPGGSGVFGVRPTPADAAPRDARERLRRLAAQLRADPRVRWVEPVPAGDGPPGGSAMKP